MSKQKRQITANLQQTLCIGKSLITEQYIYTCPDTALTIIVHTVEDAMHSLADISTEQMRKKTRQIFFDDRLYLHAVYTFFRFDGERLRQRSTKS
jgi:hypothetical protein